MPWVIVGACLTYLSQNLKSVEEMEEEEREAQSAKLQELIRRGTPEDLQEANRLMKVMAGYDTRSKVDYRAKAAEDVGKIQQKARLLEERLEAFKPGDKIVDGDVFSELAAALSSAQPKIQKMCEEESDDHEAVAKLLEINDSIHRTVERYRLLKKGDIEGAKALASGAPVSSTSNGSGSGAGKSAAQELSLIDFDAEPSGGDSTSQSAPQAGNSLENDLLGLSLGETSSYGQGGGIALGFGANTSMSLAAFRARVKERMLLITHHRHSWTGTALIHYAEQHRTGPLPSTWPILFQQFQLIRITSCFSIKHPQASRVYGIRFFRASCVVNSVQRPICCSSLSLLFLYPSASASTSCYR